MTTEQIDGPDPALRMALEALADGLRTVAATLVWEGTPGRTAERLIDLAPLFVAAGEALGGMGASDPGKAPSASA